MLDPAPPAPRPTLRVLLVDDELLVRRLIARQLEAAWGCRVVEAHDGQAALERLADGDVPDFDLVVTDLRMPRLDGISLGRAMRERWPGLPVVFMSAYAAEHEAELRALLGGSPLLQKPFAAPVLLETIVRLFPPPGA